MINSEKSTEGNIQLPSEDAKLPHCREELPNVGAQSPEKKYLIKFEVHETDYKQLKAMAQFMRKQGLIQRPAVNHLARAGLYKLYNDSNGVLIREAEKHRLNIFPRQTTQ